MQKSFTINDLPREDRPRERLQKFGAEVLSSQELLALILGRGVRGESVMMTAQQLLSRFGSLQSVLNASLEDLQKINGLGVAKSAQIKACCEMAKRTDTLGQSGSQDKTDNVLISSPKDVQRIVNTKLRNYNKEHFLVLSLDTRDRCIGIDTIAVGTLDANLVHPRETFGAAIARHASHIIVSHNHPSGDPTPSEADIETTKRLRDAGQLMGIDLADHIIVTNNSFFGFKDNGLL